MIFDGKNPDYANVVKCQEYKDSGGKIHCGHDFWKQARKMDFGDVILCPRCNVYFAKIKHAPWVVKKTKWLSNKVIGYGTNHLGFNGDSNDYMRRDNKEFFMVPVPVRVSD